MLQEEGLNIEVDLVNIGEALRDLKFLKILTLSSVVYTGFTFHRRRSVWLSPGDQHNFVHQLFQRHFPTLTTIVFSPWMVWHLRTPTLSDKECHCELELLSAEIWEELDALANRDKVLPVPVRDWNGKLASAFKRKPFRLDWAGEKRTPGILMAMIADTSSCA